MKKHPKFHLLPGDPVVITDHPNKDLIGHVGHIIEKLANSSNIYRIQLSSELGTVHLYWLHILPANALLCELTFIGEH